jgi:lipoprotein-releasing system permease protein
MFELSVAFKYLVPRWRQLSVSIISLISILVIALVVWLIVVFFSVTHGLERGWINKLIALTAPIRVTPTEEYYNSYYYLIDSISQDSGYTSQTIGGKLASQVTDPYDPDYDQEIPLYWAKADLDGNGNQKDLVKLAFQVIQDVNGTTSNEFETTITTLKLKLGKDAFLADPDDSESDPRMLSQTIYLSSFDPSNPNLPKTMFPVSLDDVNNLMRTAETALHTEPGQGKELFKEVLKTVIPIGFKTPPEGWQIRHELLPDDCKLHVCALKSNDHILAVYIPNKPGEMPISNSIPGILKKNADVCTLCFDEEDDIAMAPWTPLLIAGDIPIQTKIDSDSANITRNSMLNAQFSVQGILLSTQIGINDLPIDRFQISNSSSQFWVFNDILPDSLPIHPQWGDAILLPKSWRESGALVGDRGYLSYQTPTASSIQEQRVPVYVAGFFDPGILPMGGRVLLANHAIVSMIRSGNPTDPSPLSNGINVRIEDLDDAESVKSQIENGFREAGIERYWKVQTYREYEFTKDFLQQLRSERNLFTLISMVIIIVACSNIVSMLIILVNDKKMEIGILRSMGATSQSIAIIFGTCGVIMGLIGSVLGIGLAILTLQNLQILIDFISRMQGFEMFNPAFFGDTLPNEVSFEALAFVLTSTALISLIAGVVPAVKASLLRPSAILRSE